MALKLKARVAETSISTGTGDITLAGAITGHSTFASRLSVADTTEVVIYAVDSNNVPTGEWEECPATYSATNILTRGTPTASSNSDAAVNFSAGAKIVVMTPSADRLLDPVGTTTHAATAKTTPADADELPLVDSAASWALKKLTWANIKATLLAYFDTAYLKLTGGTLSGDLTLTSGQLNLSTYHHIDWVSSVHSINFQISGTTNHFSLNANNGPQVISVRAYNWVSTNNAGTGTVDLSLYRDAANTLAQRNGTNTQTSRLYGTYTDASNYRRVSLGMTTAGVATLTPEGAGTGASGNTLMPVTGSVTVANLPTASSALTGARLFVSDATATTFLSTVAGGGANKVPVVCDGTTWLIG